MIRKQYLLLILVALLFVGRFFSSPKSPESAVKKVEQTQIKPQPVVVNKSPKEIRLEYAEEMQKSLLSDGVDAHVYVTGKERDTIRISIPAMNRPMVYQLITSSDGIRKQLPQLGFKKLRLDNRIEGVEDTSMWEFVWHEAAGGWVQQ